MTVPDFLNKVKELREITGVGFKDCKQAIDACGGDIEKSIDFLRKKGISKAGKKMLRVAADGLVAIQESDNKICIVEINCETDFVAKNKEFIKFSDEILKISFQNKSDLTLVENEKIFGNKITKDYLVDLISKIGEKISIRRSSFFDNKNLKNYYYIHNPTKENMGKIGVVVSIETKKTKNEFQDFGKKIAMHIAAMNPLSINEQDLDINIINKENTIIIEELKNSGKKAPIIDKIAKGKLNKFIAENTLLNQIWIIDSKKKVKEAIKESLDGEAIIKGFTRFKVGEGL